VSSNPNQDPSDLIKNLGEHFRQVRFGSGVVGKTSYAVLALVSVWGIVFWRLSENVAQNLSMLGGAFVITAFVGWWIHRTQEFAEKNPSAALLEGAQLLEYQKFQLEVKGGAALPPSQARPIDDPRLPAKPTSDPDKADR
jgi:hypothetical protein